MVNSIGVAYSSLGGLRFVGIRAALPTGAVLHCEYRNGLYAWRRLAWDVESNAFLCVALSTRRIREEARKSGTFERTIVGIVASLSDLVRTSY